MTVEYDEKNQGFMVHQSSSLKATPDIIRLGGSNAGTNAIFGGIGTLANDLGIDDGSSLTYQTVNGSKQLSVTLGVTERHLLQAAGDRVLRLHMLVASSHLSGTTGDASSISIR